MKKLGFYISISMVIIASAIINALFKPWQGMIGMAAYFGIYCVLLCCAVPIYFLYRENGKLSGLGLFKPNAKDSIIIAGGLIITAGLLLLIPWNKDKINVHVLASFLLIGLCEELFFRGYLQTRLQRLLPVPVAILSTAALSALILLTRNGFMNGYEILIPIAMTLLVSSAYAFTGNLIVAAILRLCFEVANYMLITPYIPSGIRFALIPTAALAAVITCFAIFVWWKNKNNKRRMNYETSTKQEG